MEIERKFLVPALPEHLDRYPVLEIEQGYLAEAPVVRIRRQNDTYILTYKSKGLLSREEYNLPLTKDAFLHLIPKIDGILITKKRYCIPSPPYTIELDVFDGTLSGLLLAEVEFPSETEALSFQPPEWFGREVTYDPAYHNSNLALRPRER